VANQWIIDRIGAAAATGSAFVPVHAHFGVRALEARPGHAAFGQRMAPGLLDQHGRLCPGAFLPAADAALGCAVASALPARRTVMSLTIQAQFVRLTPGDATDFVVRGDAVQIGPGSGFAAGEIVDDTGRLIARLSTHCGYLTIPDLPPALPFAGHSLDDSLAGYTARETADDELAPLAQAAGARRIDAPEGDVLIRATSTPDIRNSRGDLQGGVLGLLAEQAITACLIRSTPAAAQADNLELDITYLRPVRPDRPDIELVARAEHASRRFALAKAHCTDSTGRLLMSASGSCYTG
jgi:uncharacterized protein (TIGR00369 family)